MSFEKFGVGGWWVHLDYNVSSGPFLSSKLINGPGPEIDNCFSDRQAYIFDSRAAFVAKIN